MKNLEIKVLGNLTYNGFTYNTPMFVEYQHTGIQYHIKNKFTSDIEIASRWISEGKKVITKPGYFFIKRIAIPTTNAKGLPDKWYITNCGDSYTVNKASKFWQKLHTQLSNNIIPDQLKN